LKIYFFNFENKKDFYSLELFFCLMVWYNPFSWGKRRDQSFDTGKYIDTPVRVRKLARVSDHLGRISPKIADTKPWIHELSVEWGTLSANFIAIENKTKANFMVAQKDTLSLMSGHEHGVYVQRLSDYLKEIDASQALNLRYQNKLKKHSTDTNKHVISALKAQLGETYVMFKKLQEIDRKVEERLNQVRYFVEKRFSIEQGRRAA
jgi:hypothetical protein